MTTSHWKQQYALALAGPDAAAAPANNTSPESNGVKRFLTDALAAAATPEAPLSLTAVGRELLVPLTELGTAQLQKAQGLDRSTVLRTLQLQVVCRLFCCCADGAKAKKTKKSKQRLKTLKKETRSLLDRIALLLDAANPPSLTDADERSPFHEFLQDVLAKAFATRLPAFTKFLLGVYELEDEPREPTRMALALPLPPPARVVETPHVPLATQSILSALRDEQRPLKRSRTETAVPFRKMQLPTDLRRRASFPSTRTDVKAAVGRTETAASSPKRTRASGGSKSRSGRSATSAGVADASTAAARSASNASSHVRRSVSSGTKPPVAASAEKPRLTHHSSLGAKPATLLRNVDRSLFAGPQSRFAPTATNNMPHTPASIVTSSSTGSSTGTRSLVARRQSPLNGSAPLLGALQRSVSGPKPPTAPLPRTAVSALVTAARASSVVMRTPDRPQRRPHRAARVLIESSPPFRNPNVVGGGGAAAAAARQRKTPSAIAPPQLG
ncbi:hypothetical protein PybrP1_008750 [[Pythium] brassicae (nom. inval.)]|nr:hypothetical protein PybrP1_008750 [[Pythium] brassicae (nom. inval.)]